MAPSTCSKVFASASPGCRHIFADGGDAGDKLRSALANAGNWVIKIIKRSDHASGFEKSSGRRAHVRLVGVMSPPSQGLGSDHCLLNRLGHDRFYPHAHPQNRKVLLRLRNF